MVTARHSVFLSSFCLTNRGPLYGLVVSDYEHHAIAHGSRELRSKKAVSKAAGFDAQDLQFHFLVELQTVVVGFEGRRLLGVDPVNEKTDCGKLQSLDNQHESKCTYTSSTSSNQAVPSSASFHGPSKALLKYSVCSLRTSSCTLNFLRSEPMKTETMAPCVAAL